MNKKGSKYTVGVLSAMVILTLAFAVQGTHIGIADNLDVGQPALVKACDTSCFLSFPPGSHQQCVAECIQNALGPRGLEGVDLTAPPEAELGGPGIQCQIGTQRGNLFAGGATLTSKVVLLSENCPIGDLLDLSVKNCLANGGSIVKC